jgi:hypothetical protein
MSLLFVGFQTLEMAGRSDMSVNGTIHMQHNVIKKITLYVALNLIQSKLSELKCCLSNG